MVVNGLDTLSNVAKGRKKHTIYLEKVFTASPINILKVKTIYPVSKVYILLVQINRGASSIILSKLLYRKSPAFYLRLCLE